MSTTEAILESVNVGLPKDVAWQGRTVHTGVWKHPVDGPRMVRRLNVDGDGQGDLARARRRAARRPRLPDRLLPALAGPLRPRRPDARPVRRELHRRRARRRRGVHRRPVPHRRGRVRGHPAARHLLPGRHAPRRARAAGAAGRPPPSRASTCGSSAKGEVQAGDDDRPDPRRPARAVSVADVDALLYLPDRDLERLRDGASTSPRSARAGSSRSASCSTRPSSGPVRCGHRRRRRSRLGRGSDRLRVAELVPESTTVTSVYLAADDGGTLPAPRAGQFLTAARRRRRKAGSRAQLLAVLGPDADATASASSARSTALVSTYVHTSCGPGSLVDVAAPRGEFVLADDAGPVLLLSAGIGVTPVLAMLHQLAAAESSRDVWWVHAARDAEQHAFAAEAHGCCSHCRAPTSTSSTPRLPPASSADGRSRRAGRRAALARLGVPPTPPPTLRPGVVHGRHARGAGGARPGAGARPHRAVRRAAGGQSGRHRRPRARPHQPPGPRRAPGRRSPSPAAGSTVAWADRHGSLLELADACDVPTRFSCRTGVCHTCVTPVLSGALAYAPEPLRAASRRGHLDLLCPTGRRPRPRPVTGVRQDPSSPPGQLAVSRRISDAARRTPATRTRSRAVDARLELGEHVLEAEGRRLLPGRELDEALDHVEHERLHRHGDPVPPASPADMQPLVAVLRCDVLPSVADTGKRRNSHDE